MLESTTSRSRTYSRSYDYDSARTQAPKLQRVAPPPAEKPSRPSRSFSADGFDRTVAHGSFEKGVAWKSANGSFGNSTLGGSGHVGVLQAGVQGDGSAFVGPTGVGVKGNVAAQADLFEADGQLSSNYGIGSTSVSGRAFVGAEGEANGSLQLDPLHGNLGASAGVDAFAGAKATADLNQTIGPVSGDAGVEGYAGIGVKADASAGFSNGKLSFNTDLGAALGIGGGIHLSGSVDVGGIASGAAHAVTSAPSAVAHFFGL